MAQIKITIPDDIYSNIKQSAKNNYRTITQEINFKLSQLFGPGNQSIPSPVLTPKRLEPDVPSPTPTTPIQPEPGPGIPTQPYEITVTSNRLASRV